MAGTKYHRQKITCINMDEMAFNSNINTALFTEGVSTCIAFIIRGKCWIDDELKSCCGLYHWSGFPVEVKNPEKEVRDTLSNFISALRNVLDVDNLSSVELSELIFIGGEKRQFDVHGELVVSGTELEVACLSNILIDFDFKSLLIAVNPEQIKQYHFLTSGDQSLSITVNPVNWSYLLNNPEDSYDSGNELTDQNLDISMR